MSSVTRTRVLVLMAAVASLAVGFVSGWVLNGRLAISAQGPEQIRGNLSHGSAPAATREEILATLRAFQEGYATRDVKRLDTFMSELFVQTDDVQLLGTDAGEWNRGFGAVGRFIRNDWMYWGNVRLDLNDATISASAQGESAWIALSGRVEFATGARPIRLTGALTKPEGKWKFEQVQFQWLGGKAGLRDLLHAHRLKTR